MGRIEKARIAGKINREAIKHGFAYAKPGISLLDLDKFLECYILENGGTPAFKGYKGFPGASCLSVNNVAVHGVPNEYQLKVADNLTIDIGTIYEGMYADSARTQVIEHANILDHLNIHTETILAWQIQILRPGITLLDIAERGEQGLKLAREHIQAVSPLGPNMNLVESLGGHYIGEKLHLDPFIPNTLDYRKGGLSVEIQKKRYRNHFLQEGDIICIEPVTTMGPTDLTIGPDGWTCSTKNTSSHFEHMILITENGHEILT